MTGSIGGCQSVIVVPCYNEQDRLDLDRLLGLLTHPHVGLMLVNDGSTDRTAELLDAAARGNSRVAVLELERNRGKAEAVREGLRAAVAEGAEIVGYLDADLSTPPEEMSRLLSILGGRPDIVMVLGARVSLLGREIRRSVTRHYLGRVFASAASIVLGLRIYDTQCGAKVMRTGPAVQRALAYPFRSRWAFDVELIGRLVAGAPGVEPIGSKALLEVPLQRWEDRGGSKLGVTGMARGAWELLLVRSRVRRVSRQPALSPVGLTTARARAAQAVPPVAAEAPPRQATELPLRATGGS